LISGNRDGWLSHAIVSRLSIAALLLVAFLFVELKQQRPMIEMRYFLRATYLGANIAGVAFAVAFLTMLTYLPFFFQSALGYAPLTAGLLMLPLAVPLFVVPRIVSVYFDHRWSGRALLALGLALIGVGLLVTSMRIALFSYMAIFVSMLVASVGAGILNGQVAKVTMSVIPVERAGMASGISGTMRFSGIVVGFAALGAILFQRIGAVISQDMPMLSRVDRLAITHAVADGNVSSAAAMIVSHNGVAALARESLGRGYQGVMFAAAIVALIATVLCWALVDARETAPHDAASGPRALEISID
jgi:Major Facilitator Superfamily